MRRAVAVTACIHILVLMSCDAADPTPVAMGDPNQNPAQDKARERQEALEEFMNKFVWIIPKSMRPQNIMSKAFKSTIAAKAAEKIATHFLKPPSVYTLIVAENEDDYDTIVNMNDDSVVWDSPDNQLNYRESKKKLLNADFVITKDGVNMKTPLGRTTIKFKQNRLGYMEKLPCGKKCSIKELTDALKTNGAYLRGPRPDHIRWSKGNRPPRRLSKTARLENMLLRFSLKRLEKVSKVSRALDKYMRKKFGVEDDDDDDDDDDDGPDDQDDDDDDNPPDDDDDGYDGDDDRDDNDEDSNEDDD